MIRSAKEAREIMKYPDSVTPYACGRADGYLICLEGPEVKALVEVLQETLEITKAENRVGGSVTASEEDISRALDQYYEAVKK